MLTSSTINVHTAIKIYYDVPINKTMIHSIILWTNTTYLEFLGKIATALGIPVEEVKIGWQLCTTKKKSAIFNELTDIEHYNCMLLIYCDAKEEQDAKATKGQKISQCATIRIEDCHTTAEKVRIHILTIYLSILNPSLQAASLSKAKTTTTPQITVSNPGNTTSNFMEQVHIQFGKCKKSPDCICYLNAKGGCKHLTHQELLYWEQLVISVL